MTRKSDVYKPINSAKPHNFNWPPKPNYDDPFVGIDGKDQNWRFNFTLLSGEETAEHTDCVLRR
jgi:hypothetical protein